MFSHSISDVIMSKIADHTIKVCKDWKTIKGRKCKRTLALKYGGSQSTWGRAMEKNLNFFIQHVQHLRRAIKTYWSLRDVEGMTEREAADACWKSYPGYHLVKYDVWNPTKGNQTERRGPMPPHFKMTKKTGPKPKLNKKDRARAKQYLDRDPDLSNAALAQKVETAKS